MPNAVYADFWEKQTSIASHKEFVAFSNKNNKATNHNSKQVRFYYSKVQQEHTLEMKAF